MKNVTGYDLVKLMSGSRGQLGVLTEVALKVLPRPEVELTLVLPGLSVDRAVAAMSAALGSPFEVTGAAHLPGQGTFLRIEGFEGSVAYRAGRLRALLAPWGEAREAPSPWAAIRDVAPLGGRQGDLWRISTRPSLAAGLIERIGADEVMLDWGGALIWVLTPQGTDLRARLGDFPGHATCLRGTPPDPVPPESPHLAELTKGLRQAFDPRGIFA